MMSHSETNTRLPETAGEAALASGVPSDAVIDSGSVTDPEPPDLPPASIWVTLLLVAVSIGSSVGLVERLRAGGGSSWSATAYCDSETLTIEQPGVITEVIAEPGRVAPSGLTLLKYEPDDSEVRRLAAQQRFDRELKTYEADRIRLQSELEDRRKQLTAAITDANRKLATAEDEYRYAEGQVAKAVIVRRKSASSEVSISEEELVTEEEELLLAMLVEAKDNRDRLRTQIGLWDSSLADLPDDAEELPDMRVRAETLQTLSDELEAATDPERRLHVAGGGVIRDVHVAVGDHIEGPTEAVRVALAGGTHLRLPVNDDTSAHLRPGAKVVLTFPRGVKGVGVVASEPTTLTTRPLFNNRPGVEQQRAFRIDPEGAWPVLEEGARVRVEAFRDER